MKGSDMIRIGATAIAGLALLALASSARSSGCCDETPRWTLTSPSFTGYDNSIVATPANDSRVNLVLLMADRRGALPAAAAPAPGAAPFFQWGAFRGDGPGDNAPDPICANRAAAAAAFETALGREASIAEGEKRALVGARRAMEAGCASGEAARPVELQGIGASEFATYLRAATAFYAGGFDAAGGGFAALKGARNPWIRETALYMVARSALNRAQAGAFDDYGSLADPAKRDRAAIADAEARFRDYLAAYPSGRYAASARGLMRRTYWLAGDQTRLAQDYARLLALDPAQRGIDDFTLAEEIDQKLLLSATPGGFADPTLLASVDLMRMRTAGDGDTGQSADTPITRAEIEAQRSGFGSNAPLFDYLLAAHAFYVAKRPADVLKIIPDAARQPRFTSVQFSRQMLRGFALDAVKDVNARGFWLELLPGAAPGYQRQAVELALALHEERSGGLARVFAPASPIRDPRIRGILLGYAAGPDLLRQQARASGAPKAERETALFVLLAKQLGRGLYAGFVSDLRLVPAGAPATGGFNAVTWREEAYGDRGVAPLGLFTAARGYGDIGCPALRDVAATLAANPRAPKALLCVGEFMRTQGFDHFQLDAPPPRNELGGAPSQFPGKPYSRFEAYKAVIADAAAPADDKAYALYRAVYCYAPSGNNDCGGVEVEPAQRKAWFLRLKRDYPQSPWAKKLTLYW